MAMGENSSVIDLLAWIAVVRKYLFGSFDPGVSNELILVILKMGWGHRAWEDQGDPRALLVQAHTGTKQHFAGPCAKHRGVVRL
jgi:hypothetical protein